METKFKETKIGRIPEEWGVDKIGDVVVKSSTRNPKKKPLEEFKYVDISSVSNVNYSIREHETMPGKDAPSRAQKEIRAQDILYATVRPYLKRIAIVPNHLDGEICSTGFCVIRCKEQSADHRFVFYILQMDWMTNKLTDLQRGSSYPAITDGDVFGQYIPLPPIPEQRQIAEILSTIDETIEKTDALIQETQQLKKGLMQKLFTEGIGHTRFKETKVGRIPEEWECRRIGEFVTEFRGGALLTPSDFISRGKKVLPKVGVVPGGVLRIPDDKQQYCSEEYAEANYKSVVDSKFIIVVLRDLVPSGPSIGLMVRITDGDEYVLAQGVYGLRIDRKRLDETFLVQLSNSSWYRKYMRRILVGSTQVHIRNSEFRNVLIPYPGIEEQERISQILVELDTQIEHNMAYRTNLEQLKKGLMQVLLTGKVRVQTNE